MKTVKMVNTGNLFVPAAKGIYASFLLMLLLLAVTDVAWGQESAGRPDRGTGGNGTQASSGIDNVNLQNGNVSMQIPLASLPPIAGGKLSYTLNAYYNSSLWNANRKEVVGEQAGCDVTYTQETVGLAENGDWRIGGQYEIMFRDASQDYDYLLPSSSQCGADYYAMQGRFFKPVLKMPDGSEHEMRIENANFPIFNGNREHLLNYYKAQGTGYFPFTSQVRLYTVDGTYITATFETSGDYTIYLKDGTQIQPATGGQRIKDMNGNSILVTASSAKDEQTGREIKWSQATYGSEPATKVEYKSVGGVDQTVWVVWGTTTVEGIIYKAKDWDVNATAPKKTCDKDQTLGNQTITVARQIILPATEQNVPSPKYVFEYDSDTKTSVTTNYVRFGCVAGSPSAAPYTRDVSGFGEISRITTPTGAEMKYSYQDLQFSPLVLSTNLLLKNALKKKEVVHDGTTDTWNYNVPLGTAAASSSMTAPDGSLYEEEYYPTDTLRTRLAGTDGLGGLTYRTKQAGRIVTEKHWTLLGGTNLIPFGSGGSSNRVTYNAVVDTEYLSLLDENGNRVKMSAKKYAYDYNGELIQTIEYDWLNLNNVYFDSFGIPNGVPSGTAVLRTVNNSYYNQAANATSTNAYHKRALGTSLIILGALQETTVGNSVTHLSYDGQSYGTAPTTGNLTQTSLWDSASNQWISSSTQYDTHGNPTLITDAKGNQTQITYGAINGYSGLYPTQTIAAYNTPIARTSTAQYDFYTGLVTSATDVDNSLTAATEYDILGRPVKVKAAVGTALEVWTQTEYSDSARRVITRSDLFAKGDGKKIAVQHFDQLGRVRLSRQIENAAIEDPYNEQHGIKIETRYRYDNPTDPTNSNGTYTLTSNPYRAATSGAAANEATMGWKVEYEDRTGNLSTTETFSGATLPAPWGSNSNSTGFFKEEEDVNATTSTDEAGKKRRTVKDALDNLTRVDEPDANNDLGSIGSPNQATSYGYDARGNLIQIQQGGQTRDFVYDSLNRLKQATNPESGTFEYTYDANGNLLTKKDARNITTTYTYDALNRVTFRDYSDATPDITYTYDDAQVAFSKGKLTKISSAISETAYTGFDAADRLLGSRQTTDGQNYTFGYTYDLGGNLLTQTYPSTKVVKYEYGSDGDLAQVSNNQTQKVYANSFGYAAHGQVEKMRLGNGKWETTAFNSRLQITNIGLGHSAADASLWKTNYEYGDWNNGVIDAQKNNGNVARQTFVVPTVGASQGFTAIQSYTYDSLDRLKSSEEKVGTIDKWKQTFLYDRFGNRNFDTTNNRTTLQSVESSVSKVVNPEALPTNNRYKQDQDNDGIADYLYDASGNVTKDAQDRTFTYDAENRQLTATGNNLSMSYAYDGNGKRVKSHNSITNQTTIFVYDGDGQMAAEYTVNVPAPTNPVISYTTEDALGSPRVISNSFGEVKARRDFLPFGEELYAGIGNRTTNQKYSANEDNTRQKFTGYQRDVETNLDFAQSRYYSPMTGRFTSPDEFKGGPDELFDFEEDASSNPTFYADLTNPQSLNKYQYTYNNPYKYTDADGHCPEGCPAQALAPPMPWLWDLVIPKTPILTPPLPVIVLPNGERVQVPRGSEYWEDGRIVAPDGRVIRPASPVPAGVRGGAEATVGRARVMPRRKTPYVPPKPRQIPVRHPSRSRARNAAEHPRPGKKLPQPKKNAPRKKRDAYDEQQKYKRPERDKKPNSRHPDSHFHDSDKSRKPVNPHHYYPKRF